MTEPLPARDEVRVSEYGLLRCPSCGESAAEILMTSHYLVLMDSKGQPAAECRDGSRVVVADFDLAVAAANISLADDVNFREKQHYRWLYYAPEKSGGVPGAA